MRRSIEALCLALSFVLAALSGCDEPTASAAGPKGYRKEFRIIENGLKMRLNLHLADHRRLPESLQELEEPGLSGYKLPTLPKGYVLHYDRNYGVAEVRLEGDVGESEE